MATPPRRVAPQSPLYFGSADASTPTAELIAALEASLALSFTQMTDQIADAQVPQSAVTQYQADLSIAWSQLTATPTTIAGYGITDAYTKTASDARFAAIAGPFPWADVTGAPAFLTSTGPFPWANVTGTPTTLAGYGIVDGITAATAAATYAPLAGPFPWADVSGTPTTLAGYGITDAYTKALSDARYALLAGPFPWADVTGTPTTLAGYGITDAYTKTASDARYALLAGPFPWSDVTGTPTTLAGYGITDAYTKTAGDARYAPIAGPFPWADVTGTPTTLGGYGVLSSDALLTPLAPLASPSFTGGVTLAGSLTFTTAVSKIIPGSTSQSLRNHADNADNLILTDAGAATFRSTVGGITTLTATTVIANLTGNVTGNTSGSSGSCTGLAATATALATARAINGVNFDGTGAITVTAAAGTLTGATLNATVTASSLTSVGILASPHMTGAVVDSGGLTVTLGDTVITAGVLTITAGTIGIGSAALAAQGIRLRSTLTGSVSQAGLAIVPTFDSGATTQGTGLSLGMTTVAASFTMVDARAIDIQNITIGSGSTVTTQAGLYIRALSGAGTNYAIFTNAGLVQLGDAVTLASTLTFSTATSKQIPGATSHSLRNHANSADNLIITDAGAATIRTSLTVTTGFGCNGAAPQTAFASGGAAPAGGTGTTAGAYDTAAHRDAHITLSNNMRTALINAGLMS